MKIAYLLNRPVAQRLPAIAARRESDDHLYGLLRLQALRVDAHIVELEDIMPASVASFIREKVLNVYWVHLPLFVRLLRYDIVFASTAFGTLFVRTLWPFKRPRWVLLDFNLSGFLGDTRTFKQRVFRSMIRKVAGIVTIDAEEARLLQERFPEQARAIRFIRFGIDTDFFSPRSAPGSGVIFSPGRDPGRDLPTLYEATARVQRKVVTTMRPWTLKKYLPLPQHATNADLTMEELLTHYSSSSMVVIPLDYKVGSHNTMGCSTLLEAMSMGKAVIITRTPMSESYVQDGVNGILVPPRDAQALSDAIQKLIADPALRSALGTRARAFVVSECSSTVFARNLRDFFQEVLSQ